MSLYNDIRPTTLEQVVGQENIKNQLQGVISSGNIPNAFLLTGPRGTGKTTIARIIARTLNCEHGNGIPCGECQSCKDILSGTSMDVIEMDAASNNKVEDVRGIIEKAQYAPMSKYKVFILDEVHMFSSGAWNALLKLIEEPPVGVVFILCTTEEHKVPATIISRCRKFYFQKIDLNVVAEYLASVCENYGKAYDEDALKLIAQASEGCMRDALSIMESFFDTDSLVTDVVANTLGVSDEDAVFGILNAISSADPSTAISIVREQSKRGKSAQLLVKALISAITDTMFVLNGTDAANVVNTTKYKQLLGEYASKTNMARCLELSKALGEVYGTLTKVPDALFLIESSLIRVIKVESANISIERIENIERRLAALEESGVSVVNAVQSSVPPSEDVKKDDVQEQSNVVEFPASDDEKGIDGINMPVEMEENSFMDIGNDVPFAVEELLIPFDDNPYLAEKPQTDKSVSTDNNNTATSDAFPAPLQEMPTIPVSQQNEVVVNDFVAEDDDVFAHLPQGTQIVTSGNTVPSSVPTSTNVAPAEEKASVQENSNDGTPSVGGVEPAIKADANISAAGFDGFADWL